MRADARRRIILYYQTQVRLQETGSEPLGLGPSFSVENGNSLACLPAWVAMEKMETLLLASEMPVSISRSRTVACHSGFKVEGFLVPVNHVLLRVHIHV